MNIYLSEYDQFYGYISAEGSYKADLGKEVSVIKVLHLGRIIDEIKDNIKNGQNYNKENVFYYNSNHLLDYTLGDIEKVKCSDVIFELLEKYKKQIKELKQNHGVKFIKGKVTLEIKENIREVKAMLNNGDISALDMSKLLERYDEDIRDPQIKKERKSKKEKAPKPPKIILTEEEKRIILIEQRKKVAEKFIDKDMSRYREVVLAKNSLPRIINKRVSSLGIYTDGSMYNHKKKGNKVGTFRKGYGIIITDEETNQILFRLRGKIEDAGQIVNDIDLVELYAVYRATHFVKSRIENGFFDKDININIHTDSLNTVKKFEKIVNNDENMDIEKISYTKLWDYIKEIEDKMSIRLKWVKGHSNNKMNNEADRVAKLGVELSGNKEELMSFSVLREVEDLFKDTEHIKPHNNPKIKL